MTKLPILPCAEKLDLVLSTAQKKHEITPTKTVKTEKTVPLGEEVSPRFYGKRSMGKRFTKKVSFEFRLSYLYNIHSLIVTQFYTATYAVHVMHRKTKLENVAIMAMYCHLRPPDAIAFPT